MQANVIKKTKTTHHATTLNTPSDHQELFKGLSQQNKRIPSKYFYDDKGSRLFNEITRLPEYYLTRSEINILKENRSTISNYFIDESVNIIELGPGEGTKSLILLEQFAKDTRDFTYMPVDVSSEYIFSLKDKLKKQLPSLTYKGIIAEFLSGIKKVTADSNDQKLILFLGSSIGNFSNKEAGKFFSDLRKSMNIGDMLYIGFDLCDDPKVLLDAYNDSRGVTKEFNLNLLNHINRECGTNFVTDNFTHQPQYNAEENAMESYLESTTDQTITLFGKQIDLHANEKILTEVSCKYSISDVENFAKAAQFDIKQHFYDSDQKFLNSLWIAT
jgi:L-histidine Nalpha-methyltransferase